MSPRRHRNNSLCKGADGNEELPRSWCRRGGGPQSETDYAIAYSGLKMELHVAHTRIFTRNAQSLASLTAIAAEMANREDHLFQGGCKVDMVDVGS